MSLSEPPHFSEEIDQNDVYEYDVKYLGHYESRGTLSLYYDRVVFSPDEDDGEIVEIPVAKIVDARSATEEDISALRVWLVGPVLGTFWKIKHDLITIDAEDEFGIVQHFVFEGDGAQEIVDQLYEIRRKRKMRTQVPEGETEQTLKITIKKTPTRLMGNGNWQCPKCLRINSSKMNFCTKCGFEKT